MKKKLGQILVTQGTVSDTDVEIALNDQSAGEPSRLGDLLVATGKLSSAQLGQALAEQYRLPFVDLPRLPATVLELVPLDLQRQFRFVPLQSQGTELSIAMADLSNVEVVAILEQQWTKVNVFVAGGDEIDALHATLSGVFTLPGEALPKVAPSISPLAPTDAELFAAVDLRLGVDSSPPRAVPAPVPGRVLTPAETAVAPRSNVASSAGPQLAEDLFGDLNLESSRTGIAARGPDEFVAPLSDSVVVPADFDQIPPADDAVAPLEPQPPAELDVFPEGSGPLLDLLTDGGTGPVLDTPFFRDGAKGSGPSRGDAPFLSSESSANANHAPVPAQAAQSLVPVSLTSSPKPTEGPPLQEAMVGSRWSGALDHVMPSKLVIGLTRVLLARGLVTEAEILAALGEKQ